MAQFNNSAGRILEVFSKLGKPDARQTLTRTSLATALGVSDNWPSIYTAMADLQIECEVLATDVLLFRGTPKYELYKQSLIEVQAVLKSFDINQQDDKVVVQVTRNATFSLPFVAADLPQVELASEDDLKRIRALCEELRQLVDTTTELTKSMRAWLLDMIRTIRDSLDRYAIRGGRGMHNQLAKLAGELALNWGAAEEVRSKQSGIWQRLTEAMDRMNTVATLAEHCGTAISFAQLNLPAIVSVVQQITAQ